MSSETRLTGDEEEQRELAAQIAELNAEIDHLELRVLTETPQCVETTDGSVLGTPGYIAPESLLAAGFTAEWLARADEMVGDQGWLESSVEDVRTSELEG